MLVLFILKPANYNMKIRFLTLVLKSGDLVYSFDRGNTTHSVPVPEALARGIDIPRRECKRLSDIVLYGSTISVTPHIPNGYEALYKNLSIDVGLDELNEFLSDPELYNTVDTPIRLNIIKDKKIWSLEDLARIDSIIKENGIYVDLADTDFSHEVNRNFVDALIVEETSLVDESYTSGNLTTDMLHPFPSSFAGNPYITAITIPEDDNYSEPDVFKGCTGLRHIGFSGSHLWKATILGDEDLDNGVDKYYIYEGMENFKRTTDEWITILSTEQEFISVITKNDDRIRQVMWYYDAWPDYEGNPGAVTKEPTPADIETILADKDDSTTVVLNIGADVPVKKISENAIAVTYPDTYVIEDGILIEP